MGLNITRSVKQMVAEANEHVEEISISDARELVGRDDVLFIDIRDIRELAKSGRISGARHVPRGMLEMWIDPDTSYHRNSLPKTENSFSTARAPGDRHWQRRQPRTWA
jgi:hypothetical protein